VRCLLVYPEFRSPSFWNYRETCRVAEARYPAAPLGLLTVAALLPPDWELRLLDRNVEPLDDALLDAADLVLTGGMIPQQEDCLDLIRAAKARGKTVVVGGPDPTSSPHLYAEADHLVLGEAEVTLPPFLADLRAGVARKVYRDEARADVSKSPCPRFDLLRLGRYLHVGVQWCRGCPFACEFCDIIELYGRVPRAKTPEQLLRELEVLHDLGYRGHVDLVDDNFIGNKRLVKQLLPRLEAWLEEHDWPFEFSTEASMNLADDDELLRMMQAVGFFTVFVGIESPDEETLVAAQKRQNTRRSIVESVRKIQRHGIVVCAGYIVGFDTEKGRVAPGILACIEETGVPVNMAGLLFALPTTQLARRLRAEGRLADGYERVTRGQGDQCTAGLNFDTVRPRADVLRDYLEVVETAYAPESYFDRVVDVGLRLDHSKRRYRPPPGQARRNLAILFRLVRRLGVPRETRRPFWSALWRVLRGNPASLRHVVGLMALYLHLGPFSRHVAEATRRRIAEEARRPSRLAPPPPRRTLAHHPAVAASATAL
jgi:hypothetical protein